MNDKPITMSREFIQTCEFATTAWTPRAQEDVAVGEIGELLTLFGRRAQGRDTPEMWHDELADAYIMITQLAILHGRQAVLDRVEEKLAKIQTRLMNSTSSTRPEEYRSTNSPAVIALRDQTHMPLLRCRQALEATNGDTQAAIEWLRRLGLASKKATRPFDRLFVLIERVLDNEDLAGPDDLHNQLKDELNRMKGASNG